MDFWNLLTGGSGPRLNKASPPATPEQRLATFTRVWQRLMDVWRNFPEDDPNTQEMLRGHVKRLTDLLIEEEKRSARLCMNFCYEKHIFVTLSKIGQAGSPAVIRECIVVFSTLIENEDEDFLGHESFAHSLISFLQATSQRSVPAFEGEFVELLFSIASKIRQSPGILRVWFTKRGDEGGYENLDKRQRFAGMTNKEDFPLFYLLIDYVHQEGKVGDFARTGLLYIVEAASSSVALEKWIVESDLATLMASGLGALYSQLSRKLVITHSTENPPTILLLSDFAMPPPAPGAETPNSPEFKTHLETFLSYLTFWQDVLEHCRSVEVKQTLLDHFQVLFLQQLLYPSLLESSDVDGGSSVAVLTYVRVVLETLDYPDIIHLILAYLMNLPEKPEKIPSQSRAKRRQSLDMLSKAADVVDSPTPAIYSLADLVMTSLSSKSQQTVSTTLRLVSTILRKHYPYSMHTLLKTTPVSDSAPARTIGAHSEEMEMLFQMVSDLTGQDKNAAQTYEDHIKDCQILLESHPCTTKFLGLKTSNGQNWSDEKLAQMHLHTLSPHDPFLRHLVRLLSKFFSNTVETNLVLTCVIIDLAACSYMRPEGWLFFDPTTYEFPDNPDSDQEEEDELGTMEDELAEILGDSVFTPETDVTAEKDRRRLRDVLRARRRPRLSRPPPVFEALLDLVAQVETYRKDVPDLDDKLMERRRAFEFTDEISEAVSSPQTSQLPAKPPPQFPMLDPFSARNLVRPATAKSSSRGLLSHPPPPRGASPGVDPSSLFENHIVDTTQRRIKVLVPGQKALHLPPPPESGEEGSTRDGSVRSSATTETDVDNHIHSSMFKGGTSDFTLSHLLTNIMILQEFILELAALTQVRASMFADVKFA